MRLCPLPLSTLLLISSELLKSTNSKIMLKIRVHDSSAVTVVFVMYLVIRIN
jgi:hypothetical protein